MTTTNALRLRIYVFIQVAKTIKKCEWGKINYGCGTFVDRNHSELDKFQVRCRNIARHTLIEYKYFKFFIVLKKQANEQTKKQQRQTSRVACFFFWSDAMAGAIACGQTKQIKKTISKQSRGPTQNHGIYM